MFAERRHGRQARRGCATIRDLDAAALQLRRRRRRADGRQRWRTPLCARRCSPLVPRASARGGAGAGRRARPAARRSLFRRAARPTSRKLRFLPALLRGRQLGAAPAGQARCWTPCATCGSHGRRAARPVAPLGFVPSGWKRRSSRRRRGGQAWLPAVPAGRACGAAIRRRDLFAAPSLRYADPRARPAGRPGLGGGAARRLPHARRSRPTRRPRSRGWPERLDAAYRDTAAEPARERRRADRDGGELVLSRPSTSWRSRPAWSRSRRPSPRGCRGWTCPSCCWRCTPAPASPTGSPTPARAARGPATSPPASAPCCWPKPATPASSR